MEYIPRILNFLIMIGAPILVAIYIGRRVERPWRLFFIGGAAFVLAQIFHFPFNSFVLNPIMRQFNFTAASTGINLVMWAVLLGLSAGIFEGVAHYLALRYWAKEERSWNNAMMYGIGHGGTEAVLLGILAAINTIVFIALRNLDLASLLPADQVEAFAAQSDAFWALPWYGAMLGGVERIWAIIIHLGATVLVFQAIRRKNIGWLFLGIGLHALFDGVAVYAAVNWGVYVTEAILGVLSIMTLVIIFALRSPEPQPEGQVVDLQPLSSPENT